MAWRLAKSLEKLRTQVNEAYPDRSKASDGTIGDEAHASRNSDHNPWVKDGGFGVVTALDITHDPENGPDAGDLAETLRLSRDPRIKYIISNRRIASSQANWAWRKYTGSNPHNKHVHISVQSVKSLYDSTADWNILKAVGIVGDPEEKPSLFRRVRNWISGSAGAGGLGFLAYLTDWQVVLAFGFVALVLVAAAIWFIGPSRVREWVRKQFR